jgi:hypothetical protein
VEGYASYVRFLRAPADCMIAVARKRTSPRSATRTFMSSELRKCPICLLNCGNVQ